MDAIMLGDSGWRSPGPISVSFEPGTIDAIPITSGSKPGLRRFRTELTKAQRIRKFAGSQTIRLMITTGGGAAVQKRFAFCSNALSSFDFDGTDR